MSIELRRNRVIAWTLGATLLLATGWALADPPGRVARLAYTEGQVSFSPAGQDDWVQAAVNRPLTTGDRLWADAGARAELQLGGAAIRMGALTNVKLLNVDDNITQLQLLQGALKVRVRRLGSDQSFEVDTPNLAFTLRRAGDYRIEVDPSGNSTAVMVNSGEAEVYGDGAAYAVRARQGYSFYGTGLTDYETFATRRDDDLDHWALERDRRSDSSVSARYVSGDVVGYEDLDSNGTWRQDASYGNVWTPNRVAAGWTPYRDGHWAWIDPWGWTWVDDAPWGFAVSHYGRWARINNAWGWVPGPQREQAVYAPALVVFLAGKDFQASVSFGASNGNVGWFPLAPREVYQPAYQVSRGYFDHINRSNAVIAPAVITNIYNTNITNVTRNVTNTTNVTNVTKVVYINQAVAGAVVAVPVHAFAQSQSVAKVAVVVASEAAVNAPTAHFAAVAPVAQSVQGGASDARAKPVAHDRNVVVARTTPPPPPIPFAAQVAQLAAKPGAPIDDARRAQLKPVAPVGPAAKVNIVAAATVAAPSALPPATPPAPKSADERKAQAAKANGAVVNANPVAPASKPVAVSVEATKIDAGKADAGKTADAAKAQAAQAAQAAKEAATAATAKNADAARADAAKLAATKADADKAAAGKADAAKAEAAKAEALRAADVSKIDAAKKAEAEKANAAKAEAAKVDAAKAEAAKSADASKADAARKAEVDRVNAAKADAVKADAVKADAARAEAAKVEAAKKVEAEKASAAGAVEAAKVEAAKRAEAAKADAARAEAAKVEAAKRAEAEKANAAKAVEAKNHADAEKAREVKAEEGRAAHAHASGPNNGAKSEEEEKSRAEEAKKR